MNRSPVVGGEQYSVVTNSTQNFGPDSFSPRQLPLRQLEKPLGNVVHLWHMDFDALSNPLHSDTNARSATLSVVQQRAIRRFYLRLLLGAYLDIPGKDVRIKRRIKGRPELDSTQSRGKLDFSVARSGGCYLIGISSGAVIGVDLEIASRRSGKPMALANRYFSKDEASALSAFEEEKLHRAFVHTWSCKEAVVKASGMGIANQLCRFTVDVDPANPPAVLNMLDDDQTAWRMATAQPVDNSIVAVAVRQRDVQLEGFSLS